MTDEDPDLLAGDNLDDLRGRNRYSPMSERFRLSELLENARYQNNLLTEKCRQLEMERDDLRRAILESLHPDVRKNYAAAKEWDFPDCFNTPEPKVDKTLKGVIIDGGKAVPPKYEDLDNG